MHATPERDLTPLRIEMGRLRIAAGLTHEHLAERAGLSRSAVIRMETGVSAGSMMGWWAVAQGLGVPLSELVAVLEEADGLRERG